MHDGRTLRRMLQSDPIVRGAVQWSHNTIKEQKLPGIYHRVTIVHSVQLSSTLRRSVVREKEARLHNLGVQRGRPSSSIYIDSVMYTQPRDPLTRSSQNVSLSLGDT